MASREIGPSFLPAKNNWLNALKDKISLRKNASKQLAPPLFDPEDKRLHYEPLASDLRNAEFILYRSKVDDGETFKPGADTKPLNEGMLPDELK